MLTLRLFRSVASSLGHYFFFSDSTQVQKCHAAGNGLPPRLDSGAQVSYLCQFLKKLRLIQNQKGRSYHHNSPLSPRQTEFRINKGESH